MGNKPPIKPGAVFEQLTVQREAPRRRNIRHWECLCSCGNTIVTAGVDLNRGHTKACGHLKAEGRNAKHGHAGAGAKRTRAYRIWQAMLNRCRNPNVQYWKYYGGRGITVCEAWKDFSTFLQDMGEPPPDTSLDRYPNPDGNYEPGNCRWASAREQRVNRAPRVRGEDNPVL